MHHALQLPEILLNIFCYLVPSGLSREAREDVRNCDLAALARTCRAFKEPALDMLWSELEDPTPLIRCLPKTSRAFRPLVLSSNRRGTAGGSIHSRTVMAYSSARPLERAEWDIIRGYACRVRHLRDVNGEFDWKMISRANMDFTPAELFFPSLQSLHCELNKGNLSLFDLPFPYLIHVRFDLDVGFEIQEPLKLLAKTSPNIKKLDFFCENWVPKYSENDPEYEKIISDGIRGRWNLHSVTCPQIPLGLDAFVHLSPMSSLTQLTIALSRNLLDSSAPSGSLPFSALKEIKLHATSLAPVSRFLSWSRLPTTTEFTVIIDSRPSKQDLILFMAHVSEVGMGQTIQKFTLNQVHEHPELVGPRDALAPQLGLDDLQSCVAFSRLSHMNFDLEWDVTLSGDELLMLGLAWPRIEELFVNRNWGWNRLGVMPHALAMLLEACPSLTSIALAINTQGYTQIPARRLFREPISLPSFKRPFRLNVLDSVIERKSMDAMAVFLATILPHFGFILTAWETWPVLGVGGVDEYRKRWGIVHRHADEIIKERWMNTLCGLLFPS